jgi:hypothetical protein
MAESRGGQLHSDDYVELWHEHCESEQEAKQRIRYYARAHRDAEKRLFLAETDADLWRHQAALYRAQLIAIGIEPLDAHPAEQNEAIEAEEIF